MKSILIVEDDITYGMMLKTWLGKKGLSGSFRQQYRPRPETFGNGGAD